MRHADQVRVYLPATLSMLRDLTATGVTSAPLPAYTVTAGVRAQLRTADQDELEYAVLLAAADQCVPLLAADPGEPTRRVVLVADVADSAVVLDGGEEMGSVRVTSPVPLARVAAVFADAPDAEPAVRAAIQRGASGSASAEPTLEKHELLWYASQEIPNLLTGP